MGAEIDHVFICCSVGGPEADALTRLGLTEGSANVHPGQGTACRRFFFSNAYLELLWVSDPKEAQAEAVLPTRLWERWTKSGQAACPFGIVLRPAGDAEAPRPPFASWSYQAPYMPPGIAIDIARGVPLTEPEFIHLGFQRGRARRGQEPVEHALPLKALTGITVLRPAGSDSAVTVALHAAGLIELRDADQYLMELTFDGDDQRARADLRPTLPLSLRW